MSRPVPTSLLRRVRIPATVLAATVAFGALSALWSVVVPLLEAPDEPDHLALVLHLADGRGYPSYDGLKSPLSVYRLCAVDAASVRACPRPGEAVTRTGTRRHPLADAQPRATRPAWNDDGGAEPVGALNQMPQHPPLYYQLMAAVLRAERSLGGGPWPLDRELALLRLANALLVAPLPLLAWWGARRFGLDQATSIAASFAVFAAPMLTHIGASLNNDNLLVLCGSTTVALLAGVLRGDRERRTAVLLGLVMGLGLLTKAFAAVFPPLAVLAYLLGARPLAAGGWRRTLSPGALVAIVTALVSGWWYVGVRIHTGSFTPTVESNVLTTALRPPGFVARPTTWAVDFLPNLNARYWGSFGWYSVRFTSPLTALLTVAVAVAVLSALASPRTPGAEGTSGGRAATAWFLLPTVCLLALVAIHSWGLYATTSKLIFAQGRYLFAGITGLAIVVAIGLRRWCGRMTPLVLLSAATVVQIHALRRCLAVYWGLPGLGPRGQLRAMVAHGGWPGFVVAMLVVVAMAAAIVLVVAVVDLVRHDTDQVVAHQ